MDKHRGLLPKTPREKFRNNRKKNRWPCIGSRRLCQYQSFKNSRWHIFCIVSCNTWCQSLQTLFYRSRKRFSTATNGCFLHSSIEQDHHSFVAHLGAI